MRIQELVTKTGLSKDTLRYYEKIEVISAPLRAANGYRLYSENHLKEIKFIKFAQSVGFPLSKIKQAIPYLNKGDPNCPILQASIAEQLEHIDNKMAELAAAKESLLKWLVRN
jgi:MerR family copper efflux transcriptional regulator